MTPTQFAAALNRLGWSATEAASALGVDERSIRRYLDGTREISAPIALLVRLALKGVDLRSNP